MPNLNKQEALQQLKKNFQKAESIFFINYQGLNVSQMNELRQKLRELNVKIQVAKNTFIRLVDPRIELKLPTAVIFSNQDSLKVLKILIKNLKELGNSFNIKLGLWKGKIYKPEELFILSQLPTKEVLIAKFAAAIKAPISRTNFILQYPLKNLTLTLKALSLKKKEV